MIRIIPVCVFETERKRAQGVWRGRARLGRGCFGAGTWCAVRCATRGVLLPIHSHAGKLSGNKMCSECMCSTHHSLRPCRAPSPSRQERRRPQTQAGSAAGAPVVPSPPHKSPGCGGREGASTGAAGSPGNCRDNSPYFRANPQMPTLVSAICLFFFFLNFPLHLRFFFFLVV